MFFRKGVPFFAVEPSAAKVHRPAKRPVRGRPAAGFSPSLENSNLVARRNNG